MQYYTRSRSATTSGVTITLSVSASESNPLMLELILKNDTRREVQCGDFGSFVECDLRLVDKRTRDPVRLSRHHSRLFNPETGARQYGQRTISPYSSMAWQIDLREYFDLTEGDFCVGVDVPVNAGRATRFTVSIADCQLCFNVLAWQLTTSLKS